MTGANGNSFGYVDQMQYFYSGNRLNGITDAVNGNLDVSDFRDNGSNSDYTYHPDGSLKSDGNRGISLIEWDTFLKKPKQITYVNGDWIKHFYDGSGRRFKTTDSEGTVWEYIDDVVYKNGEFYQISDDEGRILFENDNYTYEFNYKDHLGNIRVSFKAVGNQLIETQENAYYPFGLSHTGTDFTLGANSNNFQYNGKEKINSFGLNYSDYGFRTYDFLTNRFISVDPLAESFAHNGVYNYAENRPINGIDLDGLEYVNANEARIIFRGADAHINTANLNATTQRAWQQRDASGKWPTGNIGFPTKIGSVTFPSGSKSPDALALDNTYGANDPTYNNTRIKTEGTHIAKSTGQVDKRFGKTLSGATGMASSTAGFALAFNLGAWGLETYGNFQIAEDKEALTNQALILRENVGGDINSAINQGIIPSGNQNPSDIGAISNIIFSGINPSNNPELYKIGVAIMQQISGNYKPPMQLIHREQTGSTADNTRVNQTYYKPNN